jgi:hypothetical protein
MSRRPAVQFRVGACNPPCICMTIVPTYTYTTPSFNMQRIETDYTLVSWSIHPYTMIKNNTHTDHALYSAPSDHVDHSKPPGDTICRTDRPLLSGLSLFHPDTIPVAASLQVSRYDKQPHNHSHLQLPRQQQHNGADPFADPFTDYISPPTSESSSSLAVSDTDARVDTESTETSETSETSETETSGGTDHYTSAQLHYYRNRDKILAYAKLRYKNNRERLLAYSKQYQQERKNDLKNRNVTYYERNRERLLKDRATKITCECGKVIAKGSFSNHLHTKYHLHHTASAAADAAVATSSPHLCP